MAERKAVNRYYPPDWNPSKGSINKYVGSHPLRERARKLDQGILVIRFEMPYNIWCGGCNNHIGMGVRYNAEKKKTGNYYSTPIYTFRMKCHLCDNYFEIQTDPKNHDYVILNGARRKEQRWDPKENEQIVPEDKETHKKLTKDAMYKLEHGTNDQQKKASVLPSLAELEERQEIYKDDFILNSVARSKFREEKKSQQASLEADQDVIRRSSLSIALVKEHQDDIKLASLLHYETPDDYKKKQKEKRQRISSSPLFSLHKLSPYSVTLTKNRKLHKAKKHIADVILKNKKSVFEDLLTPNSARTSLSFKVQSPSGPSTKSPVLEVKSLKETAGAKTEETIVSEDTQSQESMTEPKQDTSSSPAQLNLSSGLAYLRTYSDSSDDDDDDDTVN